MTKIRNEINIKSIIEDYVPMPFDIFETDSKMRVLKEIICNQLTIPERNMIIYYSECQSQRQLAKALGVSLATANHELKKITDKIKRLYYDIKSNADNLHSGDGY